ncbi:MAG: 50S ribosomal protein L29 [Planctomycetota bacterium]|jgi:large subunit ribosomal protein L29|nr:50S ribosomal protein L29 [Planctomycetota bacterium]
MKPQEVRDMSREQILQELEALERKVFDLRTQAETEELHMSSELRKARRNIARMRTILRQREMSQAPAAEAGKETASE